VFKFYFILWSLSPTIRKHLRHVYFFWSVWHAYQWLHIFLVGNYVSSDQKKSMAFPATYAAMLICTYIILLETRNSLKRKKCYKNVPMLVVKSLCLANLYLRFGLGVVHLIWKLFYSYEMKNWILCAQNKWLVIFWIFNLFSWASALVSFFDIKLVLVRFLVRLEFQ
jgi:hypothetical protein